MKNSSLRKLPTIGVCGLDCGLCPRHYTWGKSRCPGCGGPEFFSKHPSCSFITCCVRKKGLEVCAECSEFPCPKFKTEDEYQRFKESSSYPSAKVLLQNLCFIRRYGMRRFEDFDDGRSRSDFCRAACLHELTSLKESLNKADRRITLDGIKRNDKKRKAKILKEILNRDARELRVLTGSQN